MSVEILLDSACDLPIDYIEANGIQAIAYKFEVDGFEYEDSFGVAVGHNSFYNMLKEGKQSRTSQINQYRYTEEFKKILDKGKDVIYICLSSALSGSYNNALAAREEALLDYPERKIAVIDSKAASLGEGLLGYYAVELKKQGKTFEEIVIWLEENKLKLNLWFTVDDLNHLKRGGRISSTTAVVGTLLSIKPILNVNDLGELKNVEKAKGRKKSIRTLADKLKENIIEEENQLVGICHCDALEDAEHLKDIITKETKVKNIVITKMGSTIGSHTGIGTLSLYFLGAKR